MRFKGYVHIAAGQGLSWIPVQMLWLKFWPLPLLCAASQCPYGRSTLEASSSGWWKGSRGSLQATPLHQVLQSGRCGSFYTALCMSLMCTVVMYLDTSQILEFNRSKFAFLHSKLVLPSNTSQKSRWPLTSRSSFQSVINTEAWMVAEEGDKKKKKTPNRPEQQWWKQRARTIAQGQSQQTNWAQKALVIKPGVGLGV
jgi:hypothetical protein